MKKRFIFLFIIIIFYLTYTNAHIFYVQIGAFNNKDNAFNLYQKYKDEFNSIGFDTSDNNLTKVVIGPIDNSGYLSDIIKKLEEKKQSYFIKKCKINNKINISEKNNNKIIPTPEYLLSSKDKFIENAKKYLGAKYVWGGASPLEGFDCSGFVIYLLKKELIFYPHSAALIYKNTISLKRKYADKGDLVFFKKRKKIDHVGIMLNKDFFIHCEYKNGVVISNINNAPYNKYPKFFSRIPFKK